MARIIILLLLIITFLSIRTNSFAHLALSDMERIESQPTGLSMLIVDYKNLEDIKFLFENSSRVLGYFEDVDGGEPFFMMLATLEQQKIIADKNFVVRVVDSNATLSDYILLYNHQVDQSEKLTPYAKVTRLSPHYTLINVPSGKDFDPHSIPDAVEFGPVPFLEEISPPPQVNTANDAPTATPEVSQNKPDNSQLLLIVLSASGVLLLVSVAGFIWLRKRKKADVTVTEIPKSDPPTPPVINN